MLLLVSSKDLIPLYLAIELLSLSLYVLAAMRRPAGTPGVIPVGAHSTEAGLRYFLLGALSSGVLLFGCGLVYVLTGQTGFAEIANCVLAHSAALPLTGGSDEVPFGPMGGGMAGIAAGALFIIIAILFKLAAAPFHM
jgi:NADH-quinone oxidoreductase subunit N